MMRSIGFSLFLLIHLLSVALSNSQGAGNDTDRVALLAFKDQISQNPLSAMSSWNSSLHFCDWEGVTCSHRHQRVIALNLHSQAMVGSISPYIGNLSFLRTLSLQNNSLHAEIPPQLGRLFRLRHLDLSNNSLSGSLPVNISKCTNLVTLIAAYNNLNGKIPEEIGLLSKLATLVLLVNNFSGEIPASFGNLSSINLLYLTDNMLTGNIPDSFGQWTTINTLELSLNRLSGMVPHSLYNISSFEVFFCSSNKLLRGSLPHDIGSNLPNLRELGFADNQFSGSIPPSLFANASKIMYLQLSYNNFTGQVPLQVGNLKRLEYISLEINHLGSGGEFDDLSFITSLNNCSYLDALSITGNRFGGMLPSSVANLSTKLTRLYFANNQISGNIPRDIGKFSSLITFSARHNRLTGSIPEGFGMIGNLQQLGLAANRFTGKIPDSIGNISSLYILDLANNTLEGTIISSLQNCQNLQHLYLANNHLTGTIPKQVFELSIQLSKITLARNNLTGPLPLEVGNLRSLRLLDVAENKISGEIPNTLGDCLLLEELYLQGNFLQGHIPSSFRSLSGIQIISLSRNKLSGNISNVLENLPSLQSLNLSFNNFEGELPTKGIFQNVTKFSIVGNDDFCGGVSELKLPKCHIPKSKRKGMSLPLKVALGVLLPSLIIITTLLLAFYCQKSASAKPYSQRLEHSLRRVSYTELHKATNGFSSENLVGVGSYGNVYKGILREVDEVIAVKVLNLVESGASKSFMAECDVLRNARHRNLIKILTVCSSVDLKGNDFKAIIFEFMSNGSLEDWLHPSFERSQGPSRNLNILQKLNIAIDVAFALEYLHNNSETPIVHCDIKPSNVLLDDDMVGYVSDFGIAKILFKNTDETSSIGVRGTIGYIPPEYGMGAMVSTQGDVFSYGIMLLEMFTGKRPTDPMFNGSQSLHNFCKMNFSQRGVENLDTSLFVTTKDDSTIENTEDQSSLTYSMKECLISLIDVGVKCSSESTIERMDIKDVLTELHKIRQIYFRSQNYENV